MSMDAMDVMLLTLAPAPPNAVARVRHLSSHDVARELARVGFSVDDAAEAAAALEDVRADPGLTDVLARLVGDVTSARGRPTSPLGIWPPLDEHGPGGRLLFHLLIALEAPRAREYLTEIGVPTDVITATIHSFVRHGEIYRRTHGRVGMDDGWWQLLALRGELLDIGRLQYHRLVVGESPLWVSPWYDGVEAAERGPGFRSGDPSIGLHIPEGAGFTPDAVDASLARAREVLAVAWPTDRRRLATCMSWLLDENLAGFLAPGSNILDFQRRFSMVPGGHDDDYDTLKFIFRATDPDLGALAQETALQRGVVARLRAGGHWRARVGWFDFDGP